MAQRIDTSDAAASDRGPRIGVWGSVRAIEPLPPDHVVTEPPVRWLGHVPRLARESPDPGLIWVAGLPDERASADLTMRDLLATWRSAERFLGTLPEGGRDWFLVREQISGLRVSYQWLFKQIRRGLPTG